MAERELKALLMVLRAGDCCLETPLSRPESVEAVETRDRGLIGIAKAGEVRWKPPSLGLLWKQSLGEGDTCIVCSVSKTSIMLDPGKCSLCLDNSSSDGGKRVPAARTCRTRGHRAGPLSHSSRWSGDWAETDE